MPVRLHYTGVATVRQQVAAGIGGSLSQETPPGDFGALYLI